MKACKDCKHWEASENCWNIDEPKEVMVCRVASGAHNGLCIHSSGESHYYSFNELETPPDFYCAHWEEKDGEEQ